jgi:NAD(P)-dependent dehydrogenase (short-subunit alcohol dehydrogenase family)
VTDPFAAQRLDGKVIVVTGSTQGLGAAVARRAAALGAAALVVCGRSRERGEAVRRELEDGGTPAVFVAADLTEVEPCREVIRAADERFGRVDGLVNAAGLSTRGTLDDTTAELWDRLFNINARAPFLLTQEAARVMRREGRGGAVVNIITMESHGGEPVLTAYASSKGALATFTRNAGYALQPDRIRVNGLNIGWTDTEGEHVVQTGEGQPDDWLAAAAAARPFGRLLHPDTDIAPMATYLLSDAGAMITGSVIDLDQTVNGPYGEHVAQSGGVPVAEARA